MELIISGRHLEIDDIIRDYTQKRLQKLLAEYPHLTTVRVIMDLERNWRIAEICLNGKHLSLSAKAKTQDMFLSIDNAADKLETQLRKHYDRLQRLHRSGKLRDAEKTTDES